MRYFLVLCVIVTLAASSSLNVEAKGSIVNRYQNDLLAEYEQKLVLVEKQFAAYKKQLDPAKMSTLDVKMKIGKFENNRNSLKSKMKDLRKSGTPISETDKADFDKRFEELTVAFEELKKLAH